MSSARRALPTPPTYHATRRPRQVALLAAALLASLLTLAVALPQAAVSASGPGTSAAAKKTKTFDFGDAPDRRNAAPGNFPSVKKSNGPRFASTKLKLGREADKERDSRQVNLDLYEDGVQLEHVPCQKVTYRFVVNVADLKKKQRSGRAFINLFVDWNLDGDWKDVDKRCGNSKRSAVPEHRVQNQAVGLAKFKKNPVQVVKVTRRAGGTATDVESGALPFWFRAVISKQPLAAPGDGSARRPQALGEVEDYGPFMDAPGDGPFADFGDAPQDIDTRNLNLQPLCQNNSAAAFVCRYPSTKAGFGPLHLESFPIHLGERVDDESDSRQVNLDFFDDGFDVGTPVNCTKTTLTWTVQVEPPLRPRPGSRARALLKRLLAQIEKRTAKIYLNAWIDADNDGNWRGGGRCANEDRSEHVVADSVLTRGELKALDESVDQDGVRSTKITREVRIPPVASEGIGCWRGQISVDQKYKVLRGLIPEPGGHVRSPYLLGETEDDCPKPHGFGGGDPPPNDGGEDGVGKAACSDGADNDGDGKIDSGDPGCLSGPDGAYDPDDQSEEDLTGTLPCPGSGEPTFSGVLTSSGSQIINHVVRIDGTVRVSGDPGPDGGLAGPFVVDCSGGTRVSIHVHWGPHGPMAIKYEFFVEHVSGPGGDAVSKSAAMSTR